MNPAEIASTLHALAKDGPGLAEVHAPSANWKKAKRRRTAMAILRDLAVAKGDPGLYVARHLTDPCARRFATWWGRGNADLPLANHLHVTVIHSVASIPWVPDPSGVVVSRMSHDKWSVLGDCWVLEFSSKRLQARFDRSRSLGAVWDYPTYRPHMSVTDKDGRAPTGLPPFDLEFGPEEMAPLDTPLWKGAVPLEELAALVHASWMEHNDAENEHHVPYADLDEKAKQVDRDAVTAVLTGLQRLGYALTPRTGEF